MIQLLVCSFSRTWTFPMQVSAAELLSIHPSLYHAVRRWCALYKGFVHGTDFLCMQIELRTFVNVVQHTLPYEPSRQTAPEIL